ncbi:MAG TPA: hypothetical protein VFE78_35275 [Gemmataceae bacterium]|nr:hypothetical protein [Gemmataceae bacterium]
MVRLRGLAALALVLCGAGAGRGEEFYYVLVFGSHQGPGCVRYSHTFATFVRATGRGPCAQSYRLDAFTISWLPRTLDVRPLALAPEAGTNLGLADTLRWAQSTGQRVSLWGPYQVERDLFDRALAQARLLESGQVCYKALDAFRPTDVVSNCVHAVTSVAGGHRPRLLCPGCGPAASHVAALRFAPWVIDCARRHEWVADRLGLGAWPLVRREL